MDRLNMFVIQSYTLLDDHQASLKTTLKPQQHI